mmetsp:Transcript_136781/g.424846  ORF Transcript_136781/g.424846 Transcript_136781/m.424846 type:complete len:189 (-) Transcript_136781:59-625(-)
MALRTVALLLLPPAALSLRVQQQAPPAMGVPATMNLTAMEIAFEKEKQLERALHAMEAAQSENARSYYYMFDEKLYSCWQGPINRLQSVINFLRTWGLQEAYLEKKLKFYRGSCDDMCMRNGWLDRRSCMRNVQQCRHPEWETMEKLTHKLVYLAYESNNSYNRMFDLMKDSDLERTCVPNGTAMFRY